MGSQGAELDGLLRQPGTAMPPRIFFLHSGLDKRSWSNQLSRADVVALGAVFVAPAVLDLPAGGLAVFVKVHAGEHHRVVHCRRTSSSSASSLLRSRSTARSAVSKSKQPSSQMPFVPLAELAHVAAEPDHLAVLELRDDRPALNSSIGRFRYLTALAAHDVAQEA